MEIEFVISNFKKIKLLNHELHQPVRVVFEEEFENYSLCSNYNACFSFERTLRNLSFDLNIRYTCIEKIII